MLRQKARARKHSLQTLIFITATVAVLLLMPQSILVPDDNAVPAAHNLLSLRGMPLGSRLGSTGDPTPSREPTLVGADALPSAQSPSEWVDITAGLLGQPPSRANASAAWDAADGEYLLFGGESSSKVVLGDTWAFKAGSWIQVNTTPSPPARFGAGLAYDPLGPYVVLFGGNNSTGTINDTWAFHVGKWTRLTPSNPPRGRSFPAMQYDPAAGEVIMFGGYIQNNQQSRATWGFDGNWSPPWAGGPGAPPARVGGSMVYDAAPPTQLLMFGGWDPETPHRILLNDTWVFNWSGPPITGSGNWMNFSKIAAPPARYDSAVVFDSSEQKVVLFGGVNVTGVVLRDVWLWNSSHWAQASFPTLPSGRFGAAVAPSPDPGAFPNTTSVPILLFSGSTGNGILANDDWYFGALSVSALPPRATPPVLDQSFKGHVSVFKFGGNSSFYSYAWNHLPAGCSTANTSSISCSPSIPSTYPVSVIVTDASGQSATSLSSNWTVNPLPTIQAFTIAPSPSVVSQQVNVSVTVAGGTGPFAYQFTGLPPGCPTQSKAVLNCYPQAVGTYNVHVVATDSDNRSANGSTFLTVKAATTSTPAIWPYLVEGLIIGASAIVVVAVVRKTLRTRTPRPPREAGLETPGTAGAHGPSDDQPHTEIGSDTSERPQPPPEP